VVSDEQAGAVGEEGERAQTPVADGSAAPAPTEPSSTVEWDDELTADPANDPSEPADSDDDLSPAVDDGSDGAAEIIGLAWDEDPPEAPGDEADDADIPVADASTSDGATTDEDAATDADVAAQEGYDDDRVPVRRNSLPRRVETWRSRSASGAIATAIAMGLQQVFEPERRRPAAVAEAPSDPYDDDDPITVDYVPDDAPATTVHVKPWLLEKGDPT